MGQIEYTEKKAHASAGAGKLWRDRVTRRRRGEEEFATEGIEHTEQGRIHLDFKKRQESHNDTIW